MSRIRRILPVLAVASLAMTALLAAAPGSASAAERCKVSSRYVLGGSGSVSLTTCVNRYVGYGGQELIYAHSWLNVSRGVRLYDGQQHVKSKLLHADGGTRAAWNNFARDFVWQVGGRRTYGTSTVGIQHRHVRFYGQGAATFDVIGDGADDLTLSASTSGSLI